MTSKTFKRFFSDSQPNSLIKTTYLRPLPIIEIVGILDNAFKNVPFCKLQIDKFSTLQDSAYTHVLYMLGKLIISSINYLREHRDGFDSSVREIHQIENLWTNHVFDNVFKARLINVDKTSGLATDVYLCLQVTYLTSLFYWYMLGDIDIAVLQAAIDASITTISKRKKIKKAIN
jgi:hypothetical protein